MPGPAVRQEPLTYLFTFMDMRNHVKRMQECEFESDMLACERARYVYDCAPLEVWQGARFVCRIEADGEFVEGQKPPEPSTRN